MKPIGVTTKTRLRLLLLLLLLPLLLLLLLLLLGDSNTAAEVPLVASRCVAQKAPSAL